MKNSTEQSSILDKDSPKNGGNTGAPQKKNMKKTSKKIITVISVLIAVFVVLPVIIVGIIKISEKSGKKTASPIGTRIETTLADTAATELFAIGSESEASPENVIKVFDLLQIKYDPSLVAFSVKVENNKIALEFVSAVNESMRDTFEISMVKYSCALMAVFNEIDEVKWVHPEYYEDGNTGGSFLRMETEKFLGEPVEKYAVSDKGIQLLMNELGLNR